MSVRDNRHRIRHAAGLDSEIARSDDDWPPARGLRDSQPLQPGRPDAWYSREDDPPAGPVGSGGASPPADFDRSADPPPPRWAPREARTPRGPSLAGVLIILALIVLELAFLFALFGPLAARPQ